MTFHPDKLKWKFLNGTAQPVGEKIFNEPFLVLFFIHAV